MGAGAVPLLFQLRRYVTWAPAFVPALLSPVLFVPQVAPAIWAFDPIGLGLIAVAVGLLVLRRRRADWNLGGVQWLVLALLVVPLLALPFAVQSFASFAAGYKIVLLEAGLLLALPVLVPRERADALLWAFPVSGLVVSAQIIYKMRGLGALRSARLELRSFYSDLGWGESNYIAAVLVLCALGTAVLIALRKRLATRLILAACAILMIVASVRLYSRGASVALALAIVVYIVGLGRLRSLFVLLATAVAGVIFVASPYSKVLVARFIDPSEYASWAVRIEIWQAMWARFAAHPWTGIGLNQGRYQRDAFEIVQAHNLFLQVLSDQGILGGLLMALVIFLLFRLVFRLRAPDGLATRELRLAALALVIATLANGMVEPTLAGYSYGILFVFFIAWMRQAAVGSASEVRYRSTP